MNLGLRIRRVEKEIPTSVMLEMECICVTRDHTGAPSKEGEGRIGGLIRCLEVSFTGFIMMIRKKLHCEVKKEEREIGR